MTQCNSMRKSGYGSGLPNDQPEEKLLEGTQWVSSFYQVSVGSGLPLTQFTRYIFYAVNQLTRTCRKPVGANLTVAEHLLRYIREWASLRGHRLQKRAILDDVTRTCRSRLIRITATRSQPWVHSSS